MNPITVLIRSTERNTGAGSGRTTLFVNVEAHVSERSATREQLGAFSRLFALHQARQIADDRFLVELFRLGGADGFGGSAQVEVIDAEVVEARPRAALAAPTNKLVGAVQATKSDLLDIWRLSGGTIHTNARGLEAGYMAIPVLLDFLRKMVDAARTPTPVALVLTGDEVEQFREWRKWKAERDEERRTRRETVDVQASEVRPPPPAIHQIDHEDGFANTRPPAP